MKETKVSELMILASEYPSVSYEASLIEALRVMRESQESFKHAGSAARSVLVLDDEEHVIGRVSHWDVLRAIEPKYRLIGDIGILSHFGWNVAFLKSMVENYGILNKPFEDTCVRSVSLQVGEIMTPVRQEEILCRESQLIEEEAPLGEAIHLFVMGGMETLFVVRDDNVIGVLRRSDVFKAISEAVEACGTSTS
jgi:CBS domain-containing protein